MTSREPAEISRRDSAVSETYSSASRNESQMIPDDDVEAVDDEQDELIDDEDIQPIPRSKGNRNASTSTQPLATPIVLPPSSISEIPRATPRETSNQGRKNRRPISDKQWNMMNTFKIRPPTAVEFAPAPAVPAEPSTSTPAPVPTTIPSPQPVLTKDVAQTFVYVPDEGKLSKVPLYKPPPVPIRPAPRKRVKREDPQDPNVQVFYHDDNAPAPTPVPDTQQAQTLAPPASLVIPPRATTPTLQRPKTPTPHIPITISPPPLQRQIGRSISKFDSTDRYFTVPDSDPLDKGSAPPKTWKSVHREMRTLGGGTWKATAWISEGEPAVPVKAPLDFTVAVTQGLLGAQNFTGLASIFAGAANTTGMLAAPKRVRKMKLEEGGSGAATPSGASTPGSAKRKSTGGIIAGGPKKPKKAPSKSTLAANVKIGSEVPSPAPVPLALPASAPDTDVEMKDV